MTDFGIYYFSGTGNTKKCAEAFGLALKNKGETELFAIENGQEKFMPAKTILIGYPVHGFGAPQVILDFAKTLPAGENLFFIFKTSGEPLRLNDDSSHSLRNILTKKGYRFGGEYHYVMPYNMIFRHTDEMASKMFLTAKERIQKDAEDIAEGKERKKKILLRAKMAYFINRIERPGVRFNGKLFRVKKKLCIHCDRCIKNCPVNNISYANGKFHFGSKCLLCARCSFLCPKDAIRIGLMDFLRVNGKYNFNADPQNAKIGKYCRRAYKRYFSE